MRDVPIYVYLAAVVVGFLLMIPLAMLFDALNWPLFNGWALFHGSFVLAWPALSLISFVVLRDAWHNSWDRDGRR
jgi:hypothetical protein